VAFALQAWPRKNTLKLSGIVTDEKSYVGIPEVNVSVVGRGAVHDAITDTRGQFVLQLSDDLKAGDDTVKLRFAKRGYVTADYNQPVVSGYAILISLVQATKDDDRGETTDAVGWITYLVNYGRTGDGAFWTGYQLSPTQDLRAPIEIRLTFSGRIIGEPRIQLVQEKLYPVSWSFLGQEGNTLTFKISDPPLRSSSILQMTVTSNKPDDAMLTAVTCVECARR
jgi:hypothetical protein